MVACCYGDSDPCSDGAYSCGAGYRGLLGTTAIGRGSPLRIDADSVSEPSLPACDRTRAKPIFVSGHFRYAKKKMWNKGVRLLCPKDKTFVEFVRNAIETGLDITDVTLVQSVLAHCCKVVDTKLGKLWHNQVSTYRVALKKCKFCRGCGFHAIS
jgi:hypothetical protein